MKILGFDYEIVLGKMEEFGHCNSGDMVIAISEDINEQQVTSTLIHEIIEAINTHMELKLKHSQIARLEAGLYCVFRENKIDLKPLLGDQA